MAATRMFLRVDAWKGSLAFTGAFFFPRRQAEDPISQAQQIGFCVTIAGVLMWSRLKLQEQARRGSCWAEMNIYIYIYTYVYIYTYLLYIYTYIYC